jgi:hypothetical protein
MDQIHHWNKILKNAVGQSVIGLHHDYGRKIGQENTGHPKYHEP